MPTDEPPPNTTPPEKEEETQIILRLPKSRKGAYVRASRAANTTLANWIFTVCDEKSNYQNPAD